MEALYPVVTPVLVVISVVLLFTFRQIKKDRRYAFVVAVILAVASGLVWDQYTWPLSEIGQANTLLRIVSFVVASGLISVSAYTLSKYALTSNEPIYPGSTDQPK